MIKVTPDVENYTITITDGDHSSTLSLGEAASIHHIYEKLCTAEFLHENSDLSYEESYKYAEEVRDLMDKYDDFSAMSESDAIVKVFNHHGLDWNEIQSQIEQE